MLTINHFFFHTLKNIYLNTLFVKKILLLILLVPSFGISFSQSNDAIVSKLKNVKELLEMDLITQDEFDSISKNLVELIMNSNNSSNIAEKENKKTNDLDLRVPNDYKNSEKLNFSFNDVYSNEFIYNGRMIKEVGFGGVLVSTSLREVRRSDGKYYIFDVSVSNDSDKTVNFTTNNIHAVVYRNGKASKIKALTRKQYMAIKKRRQNLREGLLAFSAGLNAASAGYSSSQTNSYGSANYSGSSNSSTDVYGSSSGYLGSFNTNTRSSGSVYGQSSSYTTSYDGSAAYAASQNEQAKLNAFIQASNENKRRWNEEYLRNHTLYPKESISGLLNVKFYRTNRVDLVITTNNYDYVFEWDPNDAEN